MTSFKQIPIKEFLVTLALVWFCGTAHADLIGGTFINGTVNPTNWDKVNGVAPFYTSFPTNNNLSATASITQLPPAPGPYAQLVTASETITPRQTNWVLTGLAILTGGAPAGQPSLHLFDETAVLTGAYSNSSAAAYSIILTNGTGGELLGGGIGLTYTQAVMPGGITNQEIFIFTNGPTSADQIVLGANRKYAVELWASTNNTSVINWMRTAGTTPVDANAGGQAMVGADASGLGMARATLSASGMAGSSPRTFALALYGYPTNAPYTISTNVAEITNDVPPPVTNGTCTVDWNTVYQHIDGFGASSAWRSTWTTTLADLFFSTNSGIVYTDNLGGKTTNYGIGLSLLRNHIYYAGSSAPTALPYTTELSIMTNAQTRGAKVWSTPWTPAVGFKNTNNLYGSLPITNAVNGGTFLGSGNNATNLAYAQQLANYVVSMKNSGVNLYAISVQNEPDAQVNTYEACQWTGAQIHDFATNLYNALTAQGVASTRIIVPESQNWTDPQNLGGPTLSDPNAAADVGIIADHDYDGYNYVPTPKSTGGKPLWETETSLLSGSDSSISNGVYYAQRIYQFMTLAQANAYHYWWLISGASGNEGLLDNNAAVTKRFYAFGQYSRFIRPNYYRIAATNATVALISAYNDTNSGNFAIVCVNTSPTAPVNQTINLANFPAVSSVTPWITSANLSLAPQASVAVSGSSFNYTLPAQSVITFVGQATNIPTVLATTLALGSSGSPSTYGDAVTFTATIQTNGIAIKNISGETVTFFDGGSQLGTGTATGSGQAAYTTTATQLSAVTHSVTAVYGGDANYLGSTNSPALSQTVAPAGLTIVGVTAADKVYDGTTNATLTGDAALNGVLGSDVVNLLTNNAAAWFADANPGTNKPVTVTGYAITGAAANNYVLSQPSGLTADILPLVPPVFTGNGLSAVAGGWQLSFSGQSGQNYKVLATEDISLPLDQWTVIATGTFTSGTVTVTDSATNLAARFYLITSP